MADLRQGEGEGGGEPAAVRRMSLNYVAAQDRLRLTAEMEDGQVLAMWLTRRLLRMLLDPLAGHLKQAQPRTAGEQAARSYVELMDKVAGKSGPAVAAADAAEEWLIDTIDVSFRDSVVRLVFKGEGGRQAAMEMRRLRLRKWLGILRRKSEKAGWAAELWPQDVLATLE